MAGTSVDYDIKVQFKTVNGIVFPLADEILLDHSAKIQRLIYLKKKKIDIEVEVQKEIDIEIPLEDENINEDIINLVCYFYRFRSKFDTKKEMKMYFSDFKEHIISAKDEAAVFTVISAASFLYCGRLIEFATFVAKKMISDQLDDKLEETFFEECIPENEYGYTLS